MVKSGVVPSVVPSGVVVGGSGVVVGGSGVVVLLQSFPSRQRHVKLSPSSLFSQ